MLWNGNDLRTHRDYFDGFTRCATPDERRRFLLRATNENPHAVGNIRYMIGYCDQTESQRLWKQLDEAINGD
jgi:hypothetical protein